MLCWAYSVEFNSEYHSLVNKTELIRTDHAKKCLGNEPHFVATIGTVVPSFKSLVIRDLCISFIPIFL